MLWIALFIGACAFFAGWAIVRDHAHDRERRLKRIRRRLAQKSDAERDDGGGRFDHRRD